MRPSRPYLVGVERVHLPVWLETRTVDDLEIRYRGLSAGREIIAGEKAVGTGLEDVLRSEAVGVDAGVEVNRLGTKPQPSAQFPAFALTIEQASTVSFPVS